MKTIQRLQFEEDIKFLYYVVFIDLLRIIWFYLVIWLIGYMFL